jgi:hypothetical protein
MDRGFLLAALLPLAAGPAIASASSMDCVLNDGFEGELAAVPASLRGVMQQHNCARKTVVPAASPPIPILRWDTSAADFAQSRANLCVYAHSNSAYGENIYAYTADSAPAAPDPAVVADWVSEGASYNYAANTCSDAQTQCLHYTQIVWRTSSAVGCGFRYCTANSPFPPPFTTWVYVVCDYTPAGNNGGRPY